ncbi:MAG: hypothetical protein ABWZ52_13800 [Acidimicrobiales bacterium]
MIGPELSRRIAAAMQHDMTPEERGVITDALADSDALELNELPEDVAALVEALEKRPYPNLDEVATIPYPTPEGAEWDAAVPTMADAILATPPR